MDTELNTISNSQKGYIGYVLVMTCVILAIYSIFGGLLFFLSGNEIENINPWLIAVTQILFLLIPTILATKPLKVDFGTIFRFKYPSLKFVITSIIGVIFIEIFTEGYLSIQEYFVPQVWLEDYQKLFSEYTSSIISVIGEGGITVFLRAVIVVAIVPSICEEFLFRGFLQTNLESRINVILAVGISSLLFGVIHLEPVLLIPLTVIGVYLGIVSYLSKSIVMPIVLHFIVNLFSIVSIFFFLPDNTDEINKTQPLGIGIGLLIVGLAGLTAVCLIMFKEIKKTKKNLQSEDSKTL